MIRILLSILLLLSVCARTWADPHPQVEMHRTQDTTKDPSGWYLGQSTKGSFSVLLPIPFNDFTMSMEDPNVGKASSFNVGGKSAEGLKFSAIEMTAERPKQNVDLAAMADAFRGKATVSPVDTSPYAGFPSATFSVKGPDSGAFFRYVKTPQSMIMLVLEYPANQTDAAESLRIRFLSSLKFKGSEATGQ